MVFLNTVYERVNEIKDSKNCAVPPPHTHTTTHYAMKEVKHMSKDAVAAAKKEVLIYPQNCISHFQDLVRNFRTFHNV